MGDRTRKDPPAGDLDAAERDIAALFGLPLPAFVDARNDLARELVSAGLHDAAARVRALPKPSVSAWTVNQLFWRHRDAFDELLDAGHAFRLAQAAHLAGHRSDLRACLDRRRDAVARLLSLARPILTEADHRATPDVLRRITTSLEALATYGRDGGGPPPGRLIVDAAPPGFEALAALVPTSRASARVANTPTTILPFARPTADEPRSAEDERRRLAAVRRKAVVDARRALRDAERSADRARRDAAKARTAMRSAVAVADDAERRRVALAATLEDATTAAAAARTRAREHAARAEQAAQEIDDAERAVTQAQARLADLNDRDD